MNDLKPCAELVAALEECIAVLIEVNAAGHSWSARRVTVAHTKGREALERVASGAGRGEAGQSADIEGGHCPEAPSGKASQRNASSEAGLINAPTSEIGVSDAAPPVLPSLAEAVAWLKDLQAFLRPEAQAKAAKLVCVAERSEAYAGTFPARGHVTTDFNAWPWIKEVRGGSMSDTAKPDTAPAEPLKHCPFCGGIGLPDRQLRRGYEIETDDPDAYAHTVRCQHCAAEGPWLKSATGAVRAWNRRHD